MKLTPLPPYICFSFPQTFVQSIFLPIPKMLMQMAISPDRVKATASSLLLSSSVADSCAETSSARSAMTSLELAGQPIEVEPGGAIFSRKDRDPISPKIWLENLAFVLFCRGGNGL